MAAIVLVHPAHLPAAGVLIGLAALAAEREELGRMARLRRLDEVTARKMIREVDLQELRYL